MMAMILKGLPTRGLKGGELVYYYQTIFLKMSQTKEEPYLRRSVESGGSLCNVQVRAWLRAAVEWNRPAGGLWVFDACLLVICHSQIYNLEQWNGTAFFLAFF
jgi:hypothetical protein